MNIRETLTDVQIQAYINELNDKGIAVVSTIYQELHAKGYAYAGWADGVATGDAITGQAALDFMQSSAGITMTAAQITMVRISMLNGYLTSLSRMARSNGGKTNDDVSYKTAQNFHVEAFTKNGLTIDNWTLEAPMKVVEKYLGGQSKVEELWVAIRETEGTGVDAWTISAGLYSIMDDIAKFGFIYVNQNGEYVPFNVVMSPDQIVSMEVTKKIISSKEIDTAELWVKSTFRIWAGLSYFEQLVNSEKVVALVGDEEQSNQNDTIYALNGNILGNHAAWTYFIYGLGGADKLIGLTGIDYLYGGTGDDELKGGNNHDHLYGGINNDHLYGEDGNDYLDGGEGNDVLDGGDGDDYLDGGNGNDSFYGGEGDDILVDEEGSDYYAFNGNFGQDTIYDKDGIGTIHINGSVLSGGEKQSETLWKSADGQYYIQVMPDFDGVVSGRKLVIQKIGDENNTITVKFWKNNDLGIDLAGVDQEPSNEITTGKGTDGDDYIVDSVYVSRNGEVYRDIRGDNSFLYNDQTDIYLIEGKQGNDSIIVDGKNYEIRVGKGELNKVITGNGHNIIKAENGSDQIFTGTGNDLVRMDNLVALSLNSGDTQTLPHGYQYDADTQRIKATWWNFAATGAGADVILGGYGIDIAYGGNDADLLIGAGGNDELRGEQGDDVIYGDSTVMVNFSTLGERFLLSDNDPAQDQLDIERAKSPYMIEDVLGNTMSTNYAYHGHDQLYGGIGNDIIFAGGGSDRVYGGGDHDILSGDAIRIFFTNSHQISISNEQSQNILIAHQQHIYTYSGEDVIYGGGGNDKILGGLKNDVLYGEDGNDIIYGDSDFAMDNSYPVEAYGSWITNVGGIRSYQWDLVRDLNTRFDVIYPHFIDENGLPLWTANDIIRGGDGHDQIWGEEGNDQIWGDEGNDIIYGDALNTEISGKYHGNDIIDGGVGNDTIFGDGGYDQIQGGQGNDILYGDGYQLEGKWHGNDQIWGDEGDDQLWGAGGDDKLYGGIGNDIIEGDDGNLDGQFHGKDEIWGDEGEDTIYGNGNDDKIYGGSGNDLIYADAPDLAIIWHGNDIIDGDMGNDIIYAGSGNDIINGGQDNDILHGGDGDDAYIFQKGHGQDIISETSGQDEISFIDISYDEVVALRVGNSLVLAGYNAHDSVSVVDFFAESGDDSSIENFVFMGQSVSAHNVLEKIINVPVDPVTNQPYQVVFDSEQKKYLTLANENNIVVISKNIDGYISYSVGSSNNVLIYGKKEAENYFSVSSSNDIQLYGGDGVDSYNIQNGSKNIQINDPNFTAKIYINTDATYFKWRYDISCDGWDILKSPTMNLVDSDAYSNYYYYLNEKSLRLNNVVYNASTSQLVIQNNNSFRIDNSDDIPHKMELVEYSDIYINNINNYADLKLAANSIGIETSEYNYSIVNGYSVFVHKTSLSLSDYINQGNVVSYYTNQDDIIYGLTNYALDYQNNHSYAIENHRGDIIYAGAGNDKVHTGVGSSLVYGEDGDDYIVALDTSAKDVIVGGIGDDVIYNYDLNYKNNHFNDNSYNMDLLYGGDGNDAIYVKYQFAQAYGGKGNDTLIGDGEFYGGEGNDKLTAGERGAYLDGGEGIDTYIGGLGDDTFVYDGTDIIVEDHKDGGFDTVITESGFDLTGTHIESIRLLGEQGARLKGNEYDNRLYGNSGDDYLDGGIGADHLEGGEGSDYYVMTEVDRIIADDLGNNVFLRGDNIVENGAYGTDTLELWEDLKVIKFDGNDQPYYTGSHWTLNTQIENVILKGNAATLFGNQLDNVITLNEQNNYIDAGKGNDTIIYQKGGGLDSLIFKDSSLANDQLIIKGYDLDEIHVRQSGNDLLIQFIGQPSDQITLKNYFLDNEIDYSQPELDQSAPIPEEGQEPEQNYISYKPKFIKLEDGTVLTAKWILDGLNHLYGSNVNDNIYGTERSEFIYGEAGNDYISGRDGNDHIYGGYGNDTLIGGAGIDILDGGAGDDKYYYYLTDGADVIDQTGGGTDVIWLMDQGITADRIKFTKENNDLLIMIDNNLNQSIRVKDHFLGGEKAISSVQPNGGYAITAAQIAAKVNSPGTGAETPNPVGDTVYNYSSGALTITEQSGTDKVVFASGITFSQISSNLTKSGNDLVIKVNGSTVNMVTVKNFFLAGNSLVEIFQTAAGEQITANQIFTAFGLTVPGTGSETPNPVGDTTYNYSSGALTITEQSGTDKVVFVSGITFSQIGSYLTMFGNDLILKVNGSSVNKITVKNFFLAGNNLVETFQFSTGEEITAADIFGAFGLTLPSAGGGTETGSSEVEGNTTYEYTTGTLTINEVSGNDKIIFKNGITFNQIGSYLNKSGNDLILKLDGSNTNKVTVKDFFLGGAKVVETFAFETGGQITASQIFGAFGLTMPAAAAFASRAVPEIESFETLDNTTYEYIGGDLLINEQFGVDNIVFKKGITFSEVANYLTKADDDLILEVNGSAADKVTVKNFFLGGAYEVESFSFDEGGSISSSQIYQAFGLVRPFNAEAEAAVVNTGDAEDNLFISDSAVSELFILNEGQDVIKLLQNTSGTAAVDYVSDFKMSEDQLDLSEFLKSSQINSSNLDDYLQVSYDENFKTNTVRISSEANGNSQEIFVLTNQAEYLSVRDLLLNQSIVY